MKTVLVEKKDIDKIISFINEGSIVSIPTETVFGLAIKYGDLDVLDKLYDVKKRDKSKAITLMVANKEDINNYALVNDKANKIISKFMPGELTIILPKKDSVDKRYTSNKSTIGIRIPNDEFMLELLNKSGPLLVSSANISNKPDLTNYKEVYNEFNGLIDMVVKGITLSKLPSTVLDLSNDEVKVLREGSIKKEEIMEVLK